MQRKNFSQIKKKKKGCREVDIRELDDINKYCIICSLICFLCGLLTTNMK